MRPRDCQVEKKTGFYEYKVHTLSGIHFVKVFPSSKPKFCAWAAYEGNSWEMLPLTLTLDEACEFVDDALRRSRE